MCCGYVCTHPQATVVSEEAMDEPVYEQLDAQKHNVATQMRLNMLCPDCKVEFVKAETLKVEQDHDFVAGVCKDCGYVKPAATPTPTPTATPTPTPAVTSTPTPVVTATPTPVVTATPTPVATATLTPVVTATPTPVVTATPTPVVTATPTPTMPAATDAPSVTDAPTMPAVTDEPTMPVVTDEPVATPAPAATARPTAKPAATATPEAEATPEPTAEPTAAPEYVEVPADAPMHGVKAEDELKIAETMIVVAQETEGESASIEIVNAEKIITPEEKAALDVLPVKEQLLTFLSVIGFEEQVNRTLEAAQEELSTNAIALKEQIQARIAAMDAEAYAAFEAALLENFPQEVIEIDGVEYTFFVLELEVRTGDTVRYERYGFRREGADWIFTRLEVAE